MSTDNTNNIMNEALRAAWKHGSTGRVVPPDTSKGETWSGQVEKAIAEIRRSKNRKGSAKSVANTGGNEVHAADSTQGNGDGQLGEQLDPFTMNDLLRKAFGNGG